MDYKSYFREKGFEIPDPVFDTRIRRFDRNGKKLVAWIYAQTVYENGKAVNVVTVGDWSTGEKYTKKDNNEYSVPAKRVPLSERRPKEDGLPKAKYVWSQCSFDGFHGYLEKKGIGGLHGAGIYKDMLVVPLFDKNRQLMSLQYIKEDGEKRFAANCSTKGGFFEVKGHPSLTYICEGFATACTIHDATQARVFATFSCLNLPVAAKIIRDLVEGPIVIAGDNDNYTKGNPGKEAMFEASRLIKASYTFPKFRFDEKGTDFNDLLKCRNLKAVTSQVLAIYDGFAAVKHLSYCQRKKNSFK